MLPLVLSAVLAVDGGVPLRMQVLAGDRGAPADTEVRLFRHRAAGEISLCGSAEYRLAPMRKPDAQGWVDFGEVAPGGYTVEADQPKWGTARTRLELPGATPAVRFAKGGDVRVRVLTAEGAPAAGATVWLVPDHLEDGERVVLLSGNDGAEYRALRSSDVGADGVVELHGLPPRHYAVLAHRFDQVLSRGVAADAGASVEVRLPDALKISGRVITSDGGVLENPWIMVDAVMPPRGAPIAAQWSRLMDPVPDQTKLDWYGAGGATDGGATFSVETHFHGRVRVSARVDECEVTPEVEVQPPVNDVVLRAGPRATVTAKIRSADSGSLDVAFTCGDSRCYWQRLTTPEFSVELPIRCTGVYVSNGSRDVERNFKLRSGQVLNLGELVLPKAKKR